MNAPRTPSRRQLGLIVAGATAGYAAALMADVTAGAIVGIVVGMFVSVAVCSIHRLWHRNMLLLFAVVSWALAALLVQAGCLAAERPVCAAGPLAVSWLPSLFYLLSWLAWTASALADAPGERQP